MHAEGTVRLPELALAADELRVGAAELQVAACDAFHVGATPDAVIAPRSLESLVACVPSLVAAGFALVPRGAGLSYSAGATAPPRPWVAVDLRRLDRVESVDAVNRRVRVQAGCTWAQLCGALAPHGLRTPFWGPASGLHATVGGTVSNDAIFYGSGRHGTAGESVLGLTVLLADGRLLRTGVDASATTPSALPFGPDATRLFVGACGAFGIVVAVTLRTEPLPAARRFAAVRCSTRGMALKCLAEVVGERDATEALLLDPAVTTALDGRAPGDVGVPGRRWHAGAPFLLTLAVDAASADEADARLQRVTDACARRGAQPAGPGLLQAFHDDPFGAPTMLRAHGRRWVPVHGIVEPARVAAALDALDDAMRADSALVAELDVQWTTTCAAIGTGAVLVEANLTWPDERNALVDDYVGPGATAVGGETAQWRDVQRVRLALVEALDRVGATHLQIGRFYPYRSRLDPVARRFVDALKHSLDPTGSMNPGVLDLPAGENA
jgi:FAD/FMN-containing dehydrogenase